MNKQNYIGFFLLMSILFLVGCNEENRVTGHIKGTPQVDQFDEDDLIETVKNATLEYKLEEWGRGLTVGEAFSDFFSATEWKCIEFIQGERPGEAIGIIEFIGDMVSPSTGEVTKVNMEISAYEGHKSVVILNMTFNDRPIDQGMEKRLVSRIYDQVYYPEAVEYARQQAAELAIDENDEVMVREEDYYDYYEPAFENNNILGEQLRNGLDPNSTNEHGQTLLLDSINDNNIEAVTLLLAYGADPNFVYQGFTPLIVAAGQGHQLILMTLIEAGADVNKIELSTPLIRAIVNGHAEIVDELIKQGADVNITPPDGYSPLNEAEYYGNAEIIHLLQQEGAESE